MKITAPDKGFSGTTTYGPVELQFTDGVADLDESQFGEKGPHSEGQLQSVLGYMRSRGYGVGSSKPTPLEEPPEPPDPRDLPEGGEVVGTRLRDAAVDPQPEDFLAPINAGEANPHGPQVVAPGIHAEGERAVRPGMVRAPEQQEQDEKDFAEALLVDNQPIGDATAAAVPDMKDHGPLGMSDPGSVQAGIDGAAEVKAQEVAEHGGSAAEAEELKGAALDAALEDAGLSKTGTADEKRARLAEHRAAQG